MLRQLAVMALSGAVTLAVLAGCESTPTRDELRVDKSDLVVGDRGMQSKDLVEMTDKLAPDILKIPEIVNNPNKIAIVMTGVTNKLESEPGRNMDIYVARLRSLLNQRARHLVLFVEKKATTENLQATEGAGGTDVFEDASRGGGAPPTRYIPQYALKGEFYDKHERKTTYYFCSFQLSNIRTGEIVWENSYEVRALNY